MLIPTKFTRLEESTIFKVRHILSDKRPGETVAELYERTKADFTDTSEFLHAMDVLFVLELLDVEWESGGIKYA
jgi:hypothetical protein